MNECVTQSELSGSQLSYKFPYMGFNLVSMALKQINERHTAMPELAKEPNQETYPNTSIVRNKMTHCHFTIQK